MSEKEFPPCDKDIYERGDIVAVLSGGKYAIDGLVKEAVRKGGVKMDWHYFAGRAVIKTLGSVPLAREALKRAMLTVLDGAL